MNGRKILLGVTGGIAAYKTAALASRLVQAGARDLRRHDPLRREAGRAEDLRGPDRPAGGHERLRPRRHPHIEAAAAAEVFCIAPATANLLAKAACGLADDLVTTTVLSFAGPILLAPAMNDKMWAKPAVQRNVAQLRADGFVLIDPKRVISVAARSGPAAWPRRKNSSTPSPSN